MQNQNGDAPGIVFSTGHGRMCPACGWPVNACRCSRSEIIPAGDGTVRVAKETKGRGGKCVTIVTGIPLSQAKLKALAKRLKRLCGAGGTVKGHVVELQGDHRDTLVTELKRLGYTVKRVGGRP